jgi:hypothetical protein
VAAPLAPDDTVARAARLLRARDLPALPVAENGRLIGAVHESDVLSSLASQASAAREARVRPLVRPFGLMVSEDRRLEEVAELLRDSPEPAVVVIAADGRYLGLLLRRDLCAALAGELPVPPIAGLATPLGVHLTTGAVRAGASDFALALTGASLMLISLLASAVLTGVVRLLQHLFPVPPGTHIPPLSEAEKVTVSLIVYGLQIVLFLVILRLSPLSGIHGAEHMVVHAIEEGEDLVPEKVRAMPRVHPRCGTNLMALLILLLIAWQFTVSTSKGNGEIGPLVFVGLVLAVLISWRRLGAGLQRWVTTKRPSPRQLEQAIAVGRSLVVRVQGGGWGAAPAGLARRVWNTGFPQVLAGFAVLSVAVDQLSPVAAHLWSHLVR